MDIERFIAELPWSKDATDYEKTLVAGNLRNLHSAMAVESGKLLEALDCRSMFSNPDALRRAADEIDCCGSHTDRCRHAWHEWDTNASGCHQSECGEYCPNDVAETLRALADVPALTKATT